MSFRKLLCPVDFSDASAAAARYASTLACQSSSALTLLHVSPAVDFEFAMAAPRPDLLMQFTAHRNHTVRQALDTFPGTSALDCPTDREVREGDPATRIIEVSREGKYDLIVMSSQGSGAIRRWLLVGSVTSKVLQAADSAVLVATDFSGAPTRFRHVLCALDLGPASRRVLCNAAGLARQMAASLTIVHAAAAFGGAARDFVDHEWRATLKTRLRESISGLQHETSTDADVQIEEGEPHTVIPELASRLNADLIVIGRGVNSGVLGRLRAHAYEIIRNAPCPVLSV